MLYPVVSIQFLIFSFIYIRIPANHASQSGGLFCTTVYEFSNFLLYFRLFIYKSAEIC